MKLITGFCIIWIGMLCCQRKMVTKSSSAIVNGIPACIQKKIDSIKQLPVWNPPAEINEYDYAGRKLYLISADCCDVYSAVMDSNCTYICAPSGGITGKGDRKCVDFFDKAKLVRLVWKDNRGIK